MKPKAQTEHEDGLLEYLEDIIGTSMYKQPIEEAQVEVDNLNEARAEKITRLSIVAKEKSSLESRKREAETYLRAMNELTRKKSLLCQFHMSTLHSNIEITENAMVTLKERLSTEESKNKSTLEEIDELQKAYNEKLEAFEQVKHHVDELTKQAKQIEKEQVSLAEKKKHQAIKQKKLKKSIHDVSGTFLRTLSLLTDKTAVCRMATVEVKLSHGCKATAKRSTKRGIIWTSWSTS